MRGLVLVVIAVLALVSVHGAQQKHTARARNVIKNILSDDILFADAVSIPANESKIIERIHLFEKRLTNVYNRFVNITNSTNPILKTVQEYPGVKLNATLTQSLPMINGTVKYIYYYYKSMNTSQIKGSFSRIDKALTFFENTASDYELRYDVNTTDSELSDVYAAEDFALRFYLFEHRYNRVYQKFVQILNSSNPQIQAHFHTYNLVLNTSLPGINSTISKAKQHASVLPASSMENIIDSIDKNLRLYEKWAIEIRVKYGSLEDVVVVSPLVRISLLEERLEKVNQRFQALAKSAHPTIQAAKASLDITLTTSFPAMKNAIAQLKGYVTVMPASAFETVISSTERSIGVIESTASMYERFAQ